MKKLRKIWTDLLSLLYQWLATILMWFSIASNFSHIQWYIEQSAIKTDWTTWAMAIVVEAGLGLSIHQFILSLRSSLMSKGQISKQDKRFNIATLPIFLVFAAFLGVFSAVCNTAFFKGDKILGSIAPALTGVFAILEAAKELLEERRRGGVATKETKPSKPLDKPLTKKPKTVSARARRDKVLALILEDVNQNTKALAQRFGVSDQTIRDDYRYLSKQNKISYIGGKASLIEEGDF